MRFTHSVLASTILLAAGCRVTPVFDSHKMRRNTATYYSGEGGVVVRGFASGDLVTCIAPPVQAVRTGKSSTEAKGTAKILDYGEFGGSGKRDVETDITEINDYEAIDTMVRTALTTACFMYGNGAFGPVYCSEENGRRETICAETHGRYRNYVTKIIETGFRCAGQKGGCSFEPPVAAIPGEYLAERKGDYVKQKQEVENRLETITAARKAEEAIIKANPGDEKALRNKAQLEAEEKILGDEAARLGKTIAEIDKAMKDAGIKDPDAAADPASLPPPG